MLNDFISVKGEKAQGNKLSSKKVHKLTLIEKEIEQEDIVINKVSSSELSNKKNESKSEENEIDSENKLIIDEDSTNNQFKLEL